MVTGVHCTLVWLIDIKNFRSVQSGDSLEEKWCVVFLALTHIHMPARSLQMQAAGPQA